ncbi:AEC family transporter [Duganella sp. FT3S]|uniref:AEC family transporter n=1 Tax=Rugamonas fusca TaxID=2758568 RepID=A0A7W2EJE7_9BURK|nr:AEC family transporter [Rugamonas fusca]MBA5607001.1 AEC family transporter [Rugamonas fusca]
MITILIALWPLFLLIVAGYAMRKCGFPGEQFWPGAERLNYFILFPALLLSSLSTAPLRDPALPRLLAAVALTVAVCGAGLLIARKIRNWPAARFGVLLQGILRFNTYLGLAAIGGLYGKPGLLFASVIIALLVPMVNVLSVLALSADRHTTPGALLFSLARNPLIVSCLAGVLLNLAGIELRWGADRLLALLANTSLPLGLLSVGAALRLDELRGQSGALIINSLTRLLIVPAVAWGCARLLALSAVETAALVLFFALPTAPTSYVLTRQLGGDSHLMAGVITLQPLLSAATLVLVMTFLA